MGRPRFTQSCRHLHLFITAPHLSANVQSKRPSIHSAILDCGSGLQPRCARKQPAGPQPGDWSEAGRQTTGDFFISWVKGGLKADCNTRVHPPARRAGAAGAGGQEEIGSRTISGSTVLSFDEKADRRKNKQHRQR